MDNSLISVIVPIYKVEPYLHKCVDSILGQTYSNIEIILVDDGSPDNCGKICDEYAAKDRRVKVIHKVNGGLSDARNSGIDIAKGNYISFVDSDDWIHPQYLEVLYNDLKMSQSDISMCSFIRVHNRCAKMVNSVDKKYKILDSDEAIRLTLYQKQLDTSAWCKLFKKELFMGLRFTIGRLYEDLDFLYKIYEKAKTLVRTESKLYYYYCRQDSILGLFNEKRLVVLDITDEILQHMKERHPNIVNAAKDRKMSANFNMLALMTLHDYHNKAIETRCWENIRELRKGRLFDPNVRLKNKFGIFVSFLGKRILKRTFIMCKNLFKR